MQLFARKKKKPDPKVYILYDFIYMIVWKRENYKDGKQIFSDQGLGSYQGDVQGNL